MPRASSGQVPSRDRTARARRSRRATTGWAAGRDGEVWHTVQFAGEGGRENRAGRRSDPADRRQVRRASDARSMILLRLRRRSRLRSWWDRSSRLLSVISDRAAMLAHVDSLRQTGQSYGKRMAGLRGREGRMCRMHPMGHTTTRRGLVRSWHDTRSAPYCDWSAPYDGRPTPYDGQCLAAARPGHSRGLPRALHRARVPVPHP